MLLITMPKTRLTWCNIMFQLSSDQPPSFPIPKISPYVRVMGKIVRSCTVMPRSDRSSTFSNHPGSMFCVSEKSASTANSFEGSIWRCWRSWNDELSLIFVHQMYASISMILICLGFTFYSTILSSALAELPYSQILSSCFWHPIPFHKNFHRFFSFPLASYFHWKLRILVYLSLDSFAR